MNKRQESLMAKTRRRLRWTQLELARRVGCSESQITKIETGRANPADWLKEAIADVLNIKTWEVGAVYETAATLPGGKKL